MINTKNVATAYALLAAALYAISAPFSKLFLSHIEPTMMAALLYLGAGLGLLIYSFFCKIIGKISVAEPLTKKELPYTVSMVVLDIAAPILLMMGIARTNSSNVSLLNNFEIVATSLIAFFVFKEVLSKRLKIAIILVTIASIVLGLESREGLTFNTGSLLVLCACICWGFENNCTKMISKKSSVEIVTIKGCFSGAGSFIIALLAGESIPQLKYIFAVLLLGFVSYGLSISFYIKAQKDLGAAKTSAYYSISPFLGVISSMVFLRERPGIQFYIGLTVMIVSTLLMVKDTIALNHAHSHTHVQIHTHNHDGFIETHSHPIKHSHTHIHGIDSVSHTHSHNSICEHAHSCDISQ